jgi:hypothetical protein
MTIPAAPTHGEVQRRRTRVAVVVYADAAHDLPRVFRGLMAAGEFREAGDDVVVVYDGSGVDTLAAASADGHPLHRQVMWLRDVTLGACKACATAHGVAAALTDSGWPLLAEHRGHASIRRLVEDGYQVLTY